MYTNIYVHIVKITGTSILTRLKLYLSDMVALL